MRLLLFHCLLLSHNYATETAMGVVDLFRSEMDQMCRPLAMPARFRYLVVVSSVYRRTGIHIVLLETVINFNDCLLKLCQGLMSRFAHLRSEQRLGSLSE